MSLRRLGRSPAGFTVVETLIVIALIGLLSVLAIPFVQSTIRHERLRASVREVYSIVLAARMQAVKRNTNAIVFVDVPNHRVVSWVETLPFNFIQDATEPSIAQYNVPDKVYFSFSPSGPVDGASAVDFDTYGGNAALVNLIVYQGDGTLLKPQAAGSGPPLRPASYTANVPQGSVNCNGTGGTARGIYMSDGTTTGDVSDRDTFRISVDDFGSTGKASLLKWIPTPDGGNAGEYDYVPGPWKWSQ